MKIVNTIISILQLLKICIIAGTAIFFGIGAVIGFIWFIGTFCNWLNALIF